MVLKMNQIYIEISGFVYFDFFGFHWLSREGSQQWLQTLTNAFSVNMPE